MAKEREAQIAEKRAVEYDKMVESLLSLQGTLIFTGPCTLFEKVTLGLFFFIEAKCWNSKRNERRGGEDSWSREGKGNRKIQRRS